jgi:hypothetical protein
MFETNEALTVQALLPGNTTVVVTGEHATEIFLGRRFDTSGLSIQSSSQVSKKLYLLGQYRRGNAIRYTDEPFQGYGNRAVGNVIYQPSEQFKLNFSLTYADLFRRETKDKVFDYAIGRGVLTYQMNKYLFFRGIVEYNTYREELLTDLLASFTYIPGTVVQFGYGSLYDKPEGVEAEPRGADRFLEMKRGLFFKASFLWRL